MLSGLIVTIPSFLRRPDIWTGLHWWSVRCFLMQSTISGVSFLGTHLAFRVRSSASFWACFLRLQSFSWPPYLLSCANIRSAWRSLGVIFRFEYRRKCGIYFQRSVVLPFRVPFWWLKLFLGYLTYFSHSTGNFTSWIGAKLNFTVIK